MPFVGVRIGVPGSTYKVGASVAPFIGSGDIKSGAFAYWSVARAYNKAYATGSNPAVDLVDQAGANQVTINILSTGLVDLASINAWVTAHSVTTIRVAKLYDQSGNLRHCSQATLANMPILLLSHPGLGNAALPVMDFKTASAQKLVSGATGLAQATGTFSVISRQSCLATGAFGGVLQCGSQFGVCHTSNGGITMYTGSVPNNAAQDEIFLGYQAVFNGASSFACINGVVGPAVNPGASNLGTPFTIGTINAANPLTGQIAEIRFDASVWSSADCVAESANQSAFWFTRTAHEGFVASRCRDLRTQDGTNVYVMARSAHIASENLTTIRVAFENSNGSGSNTITQSIEYPAGAFTQVLFGGGATGTIKSSATIVSDYATIAGGIPAGATFWVRTFWHGVASFYNSWQNTFLGEATQISASVISDLTMGGTITNSGAYSMPPVGIIGVTTNASVLIFGDSIAMGFGDVEDSSNSATGYNGVVGYIARSLGSVTFTNLGRASAPGIATAIGKNMLGFGSHLMCEFGSNDFYLNSKTSAQLIAGLKAILDTRRPGQKVYQTTITPKTTSTDSYATVANQTIAAPTTNTERVTFNTAVRAGSTGMTTLTGFIDAASIAESSLNSGKWTASPSPPYTADGLHPNVAGSALVAAGGVVPTPSWP